MAKAKNLQVIEVGEGWVVRNEGELRIQSMHDTIEEAEQAALTLAQREGGQVLIQGRDGRFRPSQGQTPAPHGRH